MLGHVLKLNPWWVAAAVVLDVMSYACQGLRWKLLLQSTVAISLIHATQAIYAGLFLNELLPFRIGEIARGYLVARWTGSTFASVLPSIVVERVFDGTWIAIGIGLTAIFVPLPRDLLRAGDLLGLVVLATAAAFLYVVFRWEPDVDRERKPGAISAFRRFIAGVRQIGRSRPVYEAFGVSAFVLVTQACAFWMVMRAYGIHQSIWVGAAVLIIVHLGTAVPNAPANVGTYRFFCTAGLSLFNVEKSLAASFSMTIFVLLTVPLWGIGFFALTHSGMTFKSLLDETRRIGARRPGS